MCNVLFNFGFLYIRRYAGGSKYHIWYKVYKVEVKIKSDNVKCYIPRNIYKLEYISFF